PFTFPRSIAGIGATCSENSGTVKMVDLYIVDNATITPTPKQPIRIKIIVMTFNLWLFLYSRLIRNISNP
ncbi:MAG: hypothetical protein ACM3X1_05910, partial [Ignavibacteriales bacterium]